MPINPGNQVIDSAVNGETIDYTAATNAVTVDLNALDRSAQPVSGADGQGGNPDTIGELLVVSGYAPATAVGKASGTDVGTDALIAIQNVVAGDGADSLTGNDGANNLTGGNGNDTLQGKGGNDTLTGGEGDDTILGGTGLDIAVYGVGVTLADMYDAGDTDPFTPGAQPGWLIDAGAEGSDTLNDVERIDSADGILLVVGHGGFDTIVEAVAYANADTSGEPITIVADSGTYAGNITITRDNVALVGRAHIQGTGTAQGVVTIAADNVTIGGEPRGFYITMNGNQQAGVYLTSGVSGVVVEANRIDAVAGRNAILAEAGVSNVEITGNTFLAAAGGHTIHIRGTASGGAVSINVDVVDNTFVGLLGAASHLVLESDNGSVYGNSFGGLTTSSKLDLWGANNTLVGPDNLMNEFTLGSAPVYIRTAQDDVSLGDVVGADAVTALDLPTGAQPLDLTGTGGADTLTGNSAANIIDGKGGNDIVDGEGGNDTFVLPKAWSNYTITRSGSTYTIVDVTTGETETVSDVENFDFNGTVISVVGDPNAIVTAAPTGFLSIVEAAPDEDGTPSTLTVAENAAGTPIGSITVTDPAGGTHTLTVDDTRFEIAEVGGANVLRLKAGQTLDFETEPTVDLQITATDAGGRPRQETFTITVTDANDAPSDIIASLGVDENRSGEHVGFVDVRDADAGNHHTITVDDARFEIYSVGGRQALRLKAGESLDFETDRPVTVTLTATDTGGLTYQETFAVTVGNYNEAPTDLAVSNLTVDEHAAGAIIGNVTVTDPDAGDTHMFSVDPNPVTSSRFEVVKVGGNYVLKLKAGQSLDYATEPSVVVNIVVEDAGRGRYAEQFTINVNNTNPPNPTGVVFTTGNDNADLPVAGGTFDALAGNDIVRYAAGTTGAVVLNGNTGIDTVSFALFGSAVWVDLQYSASPNEAWTRDTTGLNSGTWRQIADLSNVENLVGSIYSDMLWGNASDNVFYYTDGLDSYDGRGGADTADFSQFRSAIWVDLAANGREAWTRDGFNLTVGRWREIADLTGIEAVVGSIQGDDLRGDANANRLVGDLGNDRLTGRGGNDVLEGGAGTDTAVFSRAISNYSFVLIGSDIVVTGEGSDTVRDDVEIFQFADVSIHRTELLAELTGPVITGESDTIPMSRLGGTYSAGDGDDALRYLGGFVTVDGGQGTDILQFNRFGAAVWVDLSYAGAEVWTMDRPTLTGGTWRAIAEVQNVENLAGSAFNDLLRGNAGDNTFFYTGGLDVYDGRGGTDTADFSLFGSAVWVDLTFTGSANEAWTRDGATVTSGTWRQIADLTNIENLTGTSHADQLFGNAGANRLEGGGGTDQLTGRGGFDTFVFGIGSGQDTITDFVGNGAAAGDTIQLSLGPRFDTFDEFMAAGLDQPGAGRVIFNFGFDNILILNNVSLGSLHEQDFLFV